MKNLLFALRPLASDFFPTIVFAVLVALHMDVRIATGGALAAALLQIIIQVARRQGVPLLQWASVALVIVFGALSIVTNDARFLMIKPSLIYLAVGVVMLKRGWMLRYMPPIAGGHGAPMMIAWGYAWAGLMLTSSAANLIVAWRMPALWPAYLAVVPMASKLVMFAAQYLSIRHVVRRRILAARAGEESQALTA